MDGGVGWIEGAPGGWVDGGMAKQMGSWTDEWVGQWVDGRMWGLMERRREGGVSGCVGNWVKSV